MKMFMGASDSAGKCIFDLLKVFNFRERNSVVKSRECTREVATVAAVVKSRV